MKVNNSEALPVNHQIEQEHGCHLFPPHPGLWIKQTIREGSKKRIKTTWQHYGINDDDQGDYYGLEVSKKVLLLVKKRLERLILLLLFYVTLCLVAVADRTFFQVKRGRHESRTGSNISRRNSEGTSPCFRGNSRTTSQARRPCAHPPASRFTRSQSYITRGLR